MRLARAAGILLVLGAASCALAGCSAATAIVAKAGEPNAPKLLDQAVENNLADAMQALEKYSKAHDGSIDGASLTQLGDYGFTPAKVDRDLTLKTSTDFDFCIQVTSPTGRTFKDHFDGAFDGGVIEGTCIEGVDYD